MRRQVRRLEDAERRATGDTAADQRGPATNPNPFPAHPEIELVELTPRERQVFMLVAEGLTNTQVADQLHLARETVKSHVRNIMAKRNLKTRQQITADAYALRLLVPRADHRAGGVDPRQ